MEKQIKQIEELTSEVSRLADAMEELATAFVNGKMYYGNVVDGLHEIARSINPERWEVKKK
jgi:basic membrane lipoprotein Med (substrate-binding protein (PBP1-ABC) superfamily)